MRVFIVKLVGITLSIFPILISPVQATSLLEVDDLQVVSEEASTQNIPILLVYSSESCNYCRRLEEEVLNPMEKNGEFKQRIVVRKVMIDSMASIKDFNGNKVEARQFAFKQRVDVTPTLQFVNAQGKQLVPKMVGYQSADFFPAYLENAISSSLEEVRR